MSTVTQELIDFRERYSLRLPQLSYRHDIEMVQLESKDGLRLFEPAPAKNILTGRPPMSLNDRGSCRYIWVSDAKSIPYIIESPVPVIGSNVPKHTNLTGGSEAYLGGEMWFTSEVSLYISGGSGRYPAADQLQLKEAVQVFESFDYEVVSLGWDDGTGFAKRYLEGS